VLDGGGDVETHRGRRLHILYRGIGALVRTLELSRLGVTLLAELESRLLLARSDAVYVYAALVRLGDVNVLVPSWLTSHLSRLGRKVERAGVTLPVASWVGLDAQGRVAPASLSLDVPGDALARLGAIDGSDSGIPEIGPEAPLRIDAVCTYDEASEGLFPATRGETVYRLGGFTANLERLGADDALGAVAALVEGAHTFEVGLGRPQQMLDALLLLAEHERSHR
jgi:hypothetical protein